MASLAPHWSRPSHPGIQDVVIVDGATFSSKSFSKISLPPFGLYARMTFPPCSHAGAATYATVQVAPNRHVSLNSDLMFINHSCEPSLVSWTTSLATRADLWTELKKKTDIRHGEPQDPCWPSRPARGRGTNGP